MSWRDWLPWSRKNATLDLFREIYGSRTTKSGVRMDWRQALRVSTALACARVIADGVAQVPLKVFQERQSGGREVLRDHTLYRLLHSAPNPWQTSFEWRETVVLHAVFTGRHYSFINRVRGEVREIIPFEPQTVEVKRARDGTLTYKVTLNDATEEFPAESIWHLRGPSWNGWEGMDAIDLARDALGLAVATEEQHARMHENGVSVPGVYSVEGKLDQSQYDMLRRFIKENYSGANKGLPMILDRGAKWLPLAMSGVDAQHLETRRFQVEEVCRFMRVMPIMVGHADKSQTYASSEQQFLAHVVHTLSPWYARIEQSIAAQLLTERDERSGVYVKFLPAGLMRGAIKDQGDYFAKALGSGGAPAWMTQDEVRELLEMNPMGGDAARLPVATNVPSPAPARDDPEPEQ